MRLLPPGSRLFAFTLPIALLAVARLSHAEEMASSPRAPPAHAGFQLDVRPGYAIPFGSAMKNNNPAGGGSINRMADLANNQLLTAVDVGVRIQPNIFAGGYIGYGAGESDFVFGTSSNTYLIGLEVQYHFSPDRRMNPWIGYGAGYEVTKHEDHGIELWSPYTMTTMSGWQLAKISGGTDYRLNHDFAIGPMVDFSIGAYSKDNVQTSEYQDAGFFGQPAAVHPAAQRSTAIQNRATHEWLTIGFRGTFGP